MKKALRETLQLIVVLITSLLIELVLFCCVYPSEALFSAGSFDHFSAARVITMLLVYYGLRFLTRIQNTADYRLNIQKSSDNSEEGGSPR